MHQGGCAQEAVETTSGERYLCEVVRGSRDLLWRWHAVRAGGGGDDVQEIEVAGARWFGNERGAVTERGRDDWFEPRQAVRVASGGGSVQQRH